MAEKKLISRTKLATIAGVTRSTVTRALDGKMAAALVAKKVDVNHPDVVAFINRNLALKEARKERDATSATKPQLSTKVEKYLDMSLREIISFFGTDVEFLDWLRSIKAIEDVKEKQIKNENSLGNLIPRDFVKQHIFAMIETINVRLLNDSPRTLAARVIEAHEAGESREKIEKLICDLLSHQLKNLKLRARRALRE